MIKVGILGSTGYAGAELVRLLYQHKEVSIQFVDSRSYAGKPYREVYPHLTNIIDMSCTNLDYSDPESFRGIDVLFCALPHGLTQEVVVAAMKSSVKIIDLSADFRIKDKVAYEAWYGVDHVAPQELAEAVYGLPEIHREDIQRARLIANPGCYSTSVILALYPLLKEKAVSVKNIISDSKSGVSGAGRGLSDGNLYSQVNESIAPYKVGTHRHTPEIEQELSLAAGEPITLQFTPHLTPMIRGILSTIYVENKNNLSWKELHLIYKKHYGEEPFIRLLEEGIFPKTKQVSGSNFVDIGFVVDQRTGNLILMSALDNLMKGASSQAVQNMNILCGFNEGEGISMLPQWP